MPRWAATAKGPAPDTTEPPVAAPASSPTDTSPTEALRRPLESTPLPRKSRLGDRTQPELDAIADKLNGRPRQTLDWKTPSQALDRAMR
jgi:hypothetical protein